MPTKIDRTFTSACEQFWPDPLSAATNDSYKHQRGVGLLRPPDFLNRLTVRKKTG